METTFNDNRAYTFQPKHPERTAKKVHQDSFCHITFKEFKTVEAMKNFLNKQDSRPQFGPVYRPCLVEKKETDAEYIDRVENEVLAEWGYEARKPESADDYSTEVMDGFIARWV